MSASVAIRTRGLTVHYGESCALQDVALELAAGAITAVVGPSGCGKSTFLSCLNRLTDLVPGCRVEGEIHVGEIDARDPSCDRVALRRRVGMIFQEPNPFPFSIRRNLSFPLEQHGVRSRAERARLLERALRDVGLWEEVADRLDRPAHGLSGGQRQRLCLARALALEPDVILLDEPCSSLDPIAAGVVEDKIVSLRGRYTVVLVTHDLAQARRVADYTALLWPRNGQGSLVEFAPTERFFAAPEHELTAAWVRGERF